MKTRMMPWLVVAILSATPLAAQTITTACKDCKQAPACPGCYVCCTPGEGGTCDTTYENYILKRSDIEGCQAKTWGCAGTTCDSSGDETLPDGPLEQPDNHNGAPNCGP